MSRNDEESGYNILLGQMVNFGVKLEIRKNVVCLLNKKVTYYE